MRRLLLLTLCVLTLCSCGSSRLYYWGSKGSDDKPTRYEELTYQYYAKKTPESLCQLICLYEDMINNPGGQRGVVPPGICAEYAYLLLQPETEAAFQQHSTAHQRRVMSKSQLPSSFHEKAILLFQKEMELYPESAVFVQPLLQKAQ